MSKRIAVLTHFFPPEACAAATRTSSLVAALVRDGHDVTVVTNFPSFPERRLASGHRGIACRDEMVAGARVVRLFTALFHGWPAARLFQWALSAFSASLYLMLCRRRFDLILASVPPITLALPALIGSARHGAELVVDVRDVYPDIAIAMGEWSACGALARITEVVVRRLYARARLVTAVTPTALRQIAARNVEAARLLLAPNGVDDTVVAPPAAGANGARFTALYAGNLGLASDIDVILDAAALLRNDAGIVIQIAGGGVDADRVRARVARESLHNVVLIDAVPRAEAMRLTAAADAAIVPLRKGITESIPTKMFDALGAGVPVIMCAEGEARSALLASGGGAAVPPGDGAALAAALRAWATAGDAPLREMGMRGREYVRRFYRREAIMQDYSRRIAAL